MTKARNIADLGSNDVIETTATGVDVTGTVSADGLTVDLPSNTGSMLFYGGSQSDRGLEISVDNSSGFDNSTWSLTSKALNNGSAITFGTRNTEHMRIDHVGNVGIGTSSPDAKLRIDSASDDHLKLNRQGVGAINIGVESSGGLVIKDDGTERMRIDSAGNLLVGTTEYPNSGEVKALIGGSGSRYLQFQDTAANTGATIGTSNGGFLIYTNTDATNGGAGSYSERARIDSSGNLLVGTTTSSSKWVAGNGVDMGFEARGAGIIVSHTSYENQLLNTDNITAHIRFYYRGSATGSINTSGSGTVYATTSDYRLKENVVALDSASDRVKALKPCRFNFITDPDNTVDGFLAHEAQEVVPEAVTGTKDEVDAEGNPRYQGIDQSKLVPLLTKALQEALTKIEQLETRIETLENN